MRPLILASLGIKRIFTEEAKEQGIILFHEIREIDPTRPGYDEFEEAISCDFEPEAPEKSETLLRLVYCNGRKIGL